MLLARQKLINRIARRAAPVTALVAPPGFGKSFVAHQLARLSGRRAEIDCSEGADIAERLAAVLQPAGDSVTVVVENAERLDAGSDALRSIVALLRRPENARVVICTRTERALHFTDHVPPHLLAMVRADQLAFDEDETAELFAGTRASDASIYRIRQLTEGWPVPMLFFAQLARDSTLDDVPPDTRAVGDLYDYLDGHVVMPLEEPVMRALATSAGLGEVSIDEFEALFGVHSVEMLVRAMCRDYQVARLAAGGTLGVHPLIAAVIRERHAGMQREALQALGNACLRRGNVERAVQCFLAADDVPKAADVYVSSCMHAGDVTLHSISRLPETCDPMTLTFYPALWVGVVGGRRLTTKPEVLLYEARRVFESLPPDCPDLLFNAVLAAYALTLKDAGKLLEARALLESARVGADGKAAGELHLLAVRARLDSVDGRHTEALQTLRKIEGCILDEPTWLSQLLRMEVTAARACGQWEVEYQAVERMLDVARKAGSLAIVGMALAEGAFGAWLAGEESLLEAYRTQLDLLTQKHHVPVLLNLDLAMLGRGLARSHSGSYEWDARAYLVAGADCDDPGRAAEYLQAAVELADNSGVALVRVLSRIAAAERMSATRTRRLQEAAEIAATIDSPSLRESVRRLTEHGEPKGMLSPLVNRLRRRSSMPQEAGVRGNLSISLAHGAVYRDESEIHVSEGGWALLAALAIEGRTVGRETLCDRLWPDMPLESATNALKMCVRRTRQQLGDADAILSTNGGYALAKHADVDLPRIDAVRAALARGERHAFDDAIVENLFERLRGGRPASFANWEWFEETEWQLQAAARELGEFLAERSLSRNDVARTLEIGRSLTALDPLDESARKLTISAHLAANDRNAALVEFRRYQKVLKEELAAEPSPDLKRMVSA